MGGGRKITKLSMLTTRIKNPDGDGRSEKGQRYAW